MQGITKKISPLSLLLAEGVEYFLTIQGKYFHGSASLNKSLYFHVFYPKTSIKNATILKCLHGNNEKW